MKVELIDYMGDDLAVVNAARVSFDKVSYYKRIPYEIPNEDGTTEVYTAKRLEDKDARLIHYLASHNHFTPFTHCFLKFRIKAPIFVARQLFKHKVGLTENEVSRRYVDSEPEFYIPLEWRKKAEDKKQGSGGTFPTENGKGFSESFSEAYKACLWTYKTCLESGLCPEQARMVLPQAMYTEWIWSGSLFAFSRVYNLRTSEDAQVETKEVALKIGELIEPLFPVSWKELINE